MTCVPESLKNGVKIQILSLSEDPVLNAPDKLFKLKSLPGNES